MVHMHVELVGTKSHKSSIGLFGRGGWSVGFLDGAIAVVGDGWGLSPTPRLSLTARLTMGVIHRLLYALYGSHGLSTGGCGYLCGYLWNIAVEHWGRTHVRMTFVTCDVRHGHVTSS